MTCDRLLVECVEEPTVLPFPLTSHARSASARKFVASWSNFLRSRTDLNLAFEGNAGRTVVAVDAIIIIPKPTSCLDPSRISWLLVLKGAALAIHPQLGSSVHQNGRNSLRSTDARFFVTSITTRKVLWGEDSDDERVSFRRGETRTASPPPATPPSPLGM